MDPLVPRRAPLAGATSVDRYLPTRQRTTVGAWCFLDSYGPDDVEGTAGMQVGPHPHIGLQTVTWLMAGEVVHRDSLGSEQSIVPGQLNLMTAGSGIAHAEESKVSHPKWLHGVQLWVALPDASRLGAPGFEHHADLPGFELDSGHGVVMVGELCGVRSPATTYSPLVGAELRLDAGGGRSPLAVDSEFEHAVLVLSGEVSLEGESLPTGTCVYLARGREQLDLAAGPGAGTDGARLMVLGGEPFTEPLVMWWNFVGRTSDDIEEARADWEAGDRFPGVPGALSARMAAPSLQPGKLRARQPAAQTSGAK